MKSYLHWLFISPILVAAAFAPSHACAWWTAALDVYTVETVDTSNTLRVKIYGTGCAGDYVDFTSANSDPDKIKPLAIAAMLNGKRLVCAVLSCDANGNGIGKQCRLVN